MKDAICYMYVAMAMRIFLCVKISLLGRKLTWYFIGVYIIKYQYHTFVLLFHISFVIEN